MTIDRAFAHGLADTSLPELMAEAARLRDAGHGATISYSPKVFIPLTHLCRDVCGYCTFAKAPRKLEKAYLTPDQVLDIARAGAAAGCTEALFTLGDRPEARYRAAREGLAELGHDSTLAYLAEVAKLVRDETGMLPHLNPGLMDDDALAMLRPVSASMGIMLETITDRLSQKGQPHYGSPDKLPARRIDTLCRAGQAKVPFTTGLLIGIGETRAERIDSLLAIADIHAEFGHIQEVIVQNFRAKPDTRMHDHPDCPEDELLWTIAAARLILGPAMNIQAPPNLSEPDTLPALVEAGINDWGGVSPVTPDHVNPEAAWPSRSVLAAATEAAGKTLIPRLPVYPSHAGDDWVDPAMRKYVLRHSDGAGFGREQDWCPGSNNPLPPSHASRRAVNRRVRDLAEGVLEGDRMLSEAQIVELFQAHGPDIDHIAEVADQLRRDRNGDEVSFVVNRNINYTNICGYRCTFCAFSKGKKHEALRGPAYLLDLEEIQRRTREAWDNGATEVCMQGGIHPTFTGDTYLAILEATKAAVPDMHVHAFSPLEVTHGAQTLGLSIRDYLKQLKRAGLGSLPGTAAEVLHDDVRKIICADKINTAEWLNVVETAHEVGLRTTSTIMFGHVDSYAHWAAHLVRLRDVQMRTGGFTEFVPLPFVHMEAPMYLKGGSRQGPTWREAKLMHAVARLALDPYITNIQGSWVKLGTDGLAAMLDAGVNDAGGTLTNESITKAAGAIHGQEVTADAMRKLIREAGRIPVQRTTLYGSLEVAAE